MRDLARRAPALAEIMARRSARAGRAAQLGFDVLVPLVLADVREHGVYEDELRHLDVDVPLGDIDSTVSAVLDGLQPRRCGPWSPLDDDARVIEMRVRKRYDAARPRVEITLTETDPEAIYLTTPSTLK